MTTAGEPAPFNRFSIRRLLLGALLTVAGSGVVQALNSVPAGDAAPPQASEGPAVASSSNAWPAKAVAPYVDFTAWPPFDILAAAATSGLRRCTLAFIVADPSKNGATASPDEIPAWGGYTDYAAKSAYRKADVDAFRALGGDVMISFGGAAGTELAAYIADAARLKAAYQSVISTYNATIVDFDIEGAWVADHASVNRRSAVIAALQSDAAAESRTLKVWFTLPALPGGLTADGVYVVNSAISNGVDIAGVNIMAMDYGDGAAPNPTGKMGDYAIMAATNLFMQLKSAYQAAGQPKSDAQLWSKVGVTPMLGVNDVQTEVFDQSEARELVGFAQTNTIGLLGFWSLNRDRPPPSGQLGQVASDHSGITQTVYEFTRIFLQFAGAANAIMTPTGINPSTGRAWAAGDTYHLAFVTAGTTQAVSSAIADYDAFVNSEAQRAGSVVAGYAVKWSAIGSTASPVVNARDHALVSAPVYRLDGVLVAAGSNDMWDASLQAPINVNQFTGTVSTSVWSGSTAAGLYISTRALGLANVRYGSSAATNNTWIEVANYAANTNYKPLYALSEPLTIPGEVIPAAPGTPSSPQPTNAAFSVAVDTMLSWNSAGASGFEIGLWPNGGLTNSAKGTGAAWDPGGLQYATTYHWQVIATNAYGSATGAVWTFTTKAPPDVVFTEILIAADTDIQNPPDYTPLAAWNYDYTDPDAQDVTVNGVAFTGTAITTAGGAAGWTGNGVDFYNGGGAREALLESNQYGSAAVPTITLSGLTAGRKYKLQYLVGSGVARSWIVEIQGIQHEISLAVGQAKNLVVDFTATGSSEVVTFVKTGANPFLSGYALHARKIPTGIVMVIR